MMAKNASPSKLDPRAKELADLALSYWERGFRVIPGGSLYERPPSYVVKQYDSLEAACRGWVKRPRFRWKEFQDRDPTREEVEGWWTQFPGANVLILTGCGVDVVDADNQAAIDWVEGGGISRTPYKVRTRKGAHYYYRTGVELRTRANPESGVDTRARGGYVVAGGSLYWSDDNKPMRYVIEAPPEFSEPSDLPALSQADADAIHTRMGHSPGQERASSIPSELEGSLSKERQEEIRSALRFLSPDCGRDEWIRYGTALKSTGGGPDVFRLWASWSLSSTVHAPEPAELRSQWDSLPVADGISISTLFEAAKRNGCDLPMIGPKSSEGPKSEPAPVPGKMQFVLVDEGVREGEATTPKRTDLVQGCQLGRFINRDVPSAEYLIEGFLLRQSLMMLSGPRGLGKSQVAMHLAQALAGGSAFFGWRTKTPARVLFFDGDMSLPMLQQRARMFRPERNPDNLVILADADFAPHNLDSINLAAVDGRRRFMEILEELRERGELPEVLIFDSISSLTWGLNEDDNTEVRAFMRWLKELRAQGFTVVYVHYAGKDKTARGASAWSEYAELVVELKPVDRSGRARGEAEFYMEFTKLRGEHPLVGQPFNRLWAKLSRKSGMWMFGDPKGERGDLHKTGDGCSALDDDIDQEVLTAVRSCMAWMPNNRSDGIKGSQLEGLLRSRARLSKRRATKVRQTIHDPRYRAHLPQIQTQPSANKQGAIYWVDQKVKGSEPK